MTTIYYKIHPPKWVEEKPIIEHRIRPGVGPLSLENICNLCIDSEIPEAWNWSVEEVCDWLVSIGLEKYVDTFKANKLLGKRLPVLNLYYLDKMHIRIHDDQVAILNGICKLFDIKPEKSFYGPILEPTFDARRQYFWYLRNSEMPDRIYLNKAISMMEWMYEKGYSQRHYKYYNPVYSRWDNVTDFNKLPFIIGRTVPNSSARLLHMNPSFQYKHPFKQRLREDVIYKELKRW